MSKIKKINKDIKINNASTTHSCKQWPTFSLLYMTTNNNYNLNYFKSSQQTERNNVTYNVFNRLLEISCHDWRYWYGLDKRNNGIETIPYNQIGPSPQGITLTDDEKVIIFRFKGSSTKDFRIIGFRRDSCPTLHIFAFDFDYTAYDHGK